MMTDVHFAAASRIFPGSPPVRAVDRLDLEVEAGEFFVLVGPSGSGKSTALRMLAGLEDVDEGTISIGGRDVTDMAPRDRDIAMVFQSYALYPHMSVADNMAFALKLMRRPRAEIAERVAEAARLLDLTPYLDRHPAALSGGQRQRVAMGRAIVREPSVFLMDEPLSNLDAQLRVETRANITALQARLRTTTLYVTHDQVEAMTMGHRVAILRDGKLQQCSTPRTLYEKPTNTFVAGFVGSPSMNLLTVPISPSGAELGDLTIALPRAVHRRINRPDITLGIRPEGLRLVDEQDPGLVLKVELVEELGADSYVYGSAELGASTERIIVRTQGTRGLSHGQKIRVALNIPSTVHLFDPETGNSMTS